MARGLKPAPLILNGLWHDSSHPSDEDLSPGTPGSRAPSHIYVKPEFFRKQPGYMWIHPRIAQWLWIKLEFVSNNLHGLWLQSMPGLGMVHPLRRA